jgi:CrcB protein
MAILHGKVLQWAGNLFWRAGLVSLQEESALCALQVRLFAVFFAAWRPSLVPWHGDTVFSRAAGSNGEEMEKIVLIGLGGGVGAILRYVITMASKRIDPSWTLGTLTANMIGCFLIGLLATLFSSTMPIREEVRLAIVVGFLGGLTTFSTFGMESFQLYRGGALGMAVLNILLSNAGGLLAIWLGFRVSQLFKA